MRTNKQKILSRAKGTITIDIPPIPFPTPITAARWLATNPVMRALYFVVMGIGIGYFWHSPQALPTIFPVPVITITETLEAFVARESQGLTAGERHKLIVVTETILREHFDTPSEMREAFRYERRKAGIDSPAFTVFSEKWEKELDRRRQTTDGSREEDSVEAMRAIYESLVRGLQATFSFLPSAVCELPSLPDEPVEGFVASPSNVTPFVSGGDVPVSPDALEETESAESLLPLSVRRVSSLQRRR